MRSAQPNNLGYKDGDGIERSIYLPQGTMNQAWDHLEKERWDELAKSEPYGWLPVTISPFASFVCLFCLLFCVPISLTLTSSRPTLQKSPTLSNPPERLAGAPMDPKRSSDGFDPRTFNQFNEENNGRRREIDSS